MPAKYKKKTAPKRKYKDKKGQYYKHKGVKIHLNVNIAQPKQAVSKRTGTRGVRAARMTQLQQKPQLYQDVAMFQAVIELKTNQYEKKVEDLLKNLPKLQEDKEKLLQKAKLAQEAGDDKKLNKIHQSLDKRNNLEKEMQLKRQEIAELNKQVMIGDIPKDKIGEIQQKVTKIGREIFQLQNQFDDLSIVSDIKQLPVEQRFQTLPQPNQPLQQVSEEDDNIFQDVIDKVQQEQKSRQVIEQKQKGLQKQAKELHFARKEWTHGDFPKKEAYTGVQHRSMYTKYVEDMQKQGKNPLEYGEFDKQNLYRYYWQGGQLNPWWMDVSHSMWQDYEKQQKQKSEQVVPFNIWRKNKANIEPFRKEEHKKFDEYYDRLRQQQEQFQTNLQEEEEKIEHQLNWEGRKIQHTNWVLENLLQEFEHEHPDVEIPAKDRYLRAKQKQEAANPLKIHEDIIRSVQQPEEIVYRTPERQRFAQEEPRLSSEQQQKEAIERAGQVVSSLKRSVDKLIQRKSKSAKNSPVREFGSKAQGFEDIEDIDDDGALSIRQLLQLLFMGIKDIQDYSITVVDNYNKKPDVSKPKQIFIFFAKLEGSDCYHFTIGIHEDNEVVIFDPLADEGRRKKDKDWVIKHAHMIDPERMFKLKQNHNAWQDTPEARHHFGKEQSNWCGEFCYLFAHNYINLGENFKEASEFVDSEDKDLLYKTVKFSYI